MKVLVALARQRPDRGRPEAEEIGREADRVLLPEPRAIGHRRQHGLVARYGRRGAPFKGGADILAAAMEAPTLAGLGRSPTIADVATIRGRFPALERKHDGRPVAYFDGPGGTQVAVGVVKAMADYLFKHNANTHWRYPSSVETDAALAEARRTFAEFFNGDPSEVAFGQNMTTLTFHLSRALGRAWGPGDEIVVTELDHHANVDTWKALARDRGVTIRTVRMRPETGQLDAADLESAIRPGVRLVAIGAASNALGTINDVQRICGLARAAGALSFVDAVHYAPHALIDVGRIGCDFLACSPYKFYGPHLGVLWGRRELIDALDVPRLTPAPDWAPERLETGTLSHEAIVGAAAAVDFLASLAGNAGALAARGARGGLRRAPPARPEAPREALDGAFEDRRGHGLRADAVLAAHADSLVRGRRTPRG